MSSSHNREQDFSQNAHLIEEAQRGDPGAMQELVELNMGLVKSIIPRFTDRGIEYEDLLQIGTIGMIKAIKSFSAEYNTVFSTYAVPLIIGEIRRYLRDDGIIKVSRGIKRLGVHAMKMKEKFIREHDREPRVGELAELCGCGQQELIVALEAMSPLHSLSEGIGDDDATLEGVLPSQENEIETLCDTLALRQALSKLDSTEQRIIYLRYFRDMSQQQTAEQLGLSQVKVSRAEKKIFQKLRGELSV